MAIDRNASLPIIANKIPDGKNEKKFVFGDTKSRKGFTIIHLHIYTSQEALTSMLKQYKIPVFHVRSIILLSLISQTSSSPLRTASYQH